MTAETAAVVPTLVLLTAMLLWGLLAVAAHLQCVDAARAGARAAARAEPTATVVRAAREIAPDGARVELTREEDLVRVRVSAHSAGPGPLAVELAAEAVAQAETSPQRSTPDEPGAPEPTGYHQVPEQTQVPEQSQRPGQQERSSRPKGPEGPDEPGVSERLEEPSPWEEREEPEASGASSGSSATDLPAKETTGAR